MGSVTHSNDAMSHWTLNDIPWAAFDPARVDPELTRLIKAACLVERDGGEYARYLCNVFHDDLPFQDLARRWGAEEVQHGQALGRWATLADPTFDLEAAFARFKTGFQHDFDVETSIRGSRVGEMVARCIVETGTSSYYSALAEAAEEPVLRAICRRVAADELRHYKLFYSTLQRCLDAEGVGLWGRLRVAISRMIESEDDELAYAYYAANGDAAPYERRRAKEAYAKRAYAVYRAHHVERGMAMIFKAVGLTPHSPLNRAATRVAWWSIQRRAAWLQRAAA